MSQIIPSHPVLTAEVWVMFCSQAAVLCLVYLPSLSSARRLAVALLISQLTAFPGATTDKLPQVGCNWLGRGCPAQSPELVFSAAHSVHSTVQCPMCTQCTAHIAATAHPTQATTISIQRLEKKIITGPFVMLVSSQPSLKRIKRIWLRQNVYVML